MTKPSAAEDSGRNRSTEAALAETQQRLKEAEEELREIKQTLSDQQNAGTARDSRRSGIRVSENTAETHYEPIAGDGDSESSSRGNPSGSGEEELRKDDMMAHLFDSLEAGTDIGHYGRLVFVMVGRHFLDDQELINWLTKDPDFDQDAAEDMLRQVKARDYNPPRRDRILAWQSEQQFPILPNAEDPDCGNVYRNLRFPERIYAHIQEYQEEKAEANQ